MSYNLNEKTAAKLILDSFICKGKCNNALYLVDFLFKTLSDDQVSKYIEILHMKESPKVPKIGDIVKCNMKMFKYDNISIDKDILSDHNVYNSYDDTIYGVIIQSDDYGDKFNPWYHKMNIEILINSDSEHLILKNITVRTDDLNFSVNEGKQEMITKVITKVREETLTL